MSSMEENDNAAEFDRGSNGENNGEAILTSTRNLCFRKKIRKVYTPVPQFYQLYKSGVRGSLNYTDVLA